MEPLAAPRLRRTSMPFSSSPEFKAAAILDAVERPHAKRCQGVGRGSVHFLDSDGKGFGRLSNWTSKGKEETEEAEN